MMIRKDNRHHRGFTLIEVLITLLIIAIGLLGLAGLQLASLQGQLEAYQRAQAVMLAEEMASRIRSNAPAARATPNEYTDGTYGLAAQVCNPATQTTAEYDLCDWNNLLLGQEVAGGVGGLSNARGCVDDVTATEGTGDGETRMRITVAWQGTTATRAPVDDVTYDCGEGQYGDDEAFRRLAIVDLVLADLVN
jgi:type IV pilus assembly protein PilV